MTDVVQPFLYDDLLRLPSDGNNYEILNGELFVSTPPGRAHQLVLGHFSRVIGNHVADHALGEVYVAPLDVRFTPRQIVRPDLLYIRRERLDQFSGNIFEGAPDLVVEVASPASKQRDLSLKLALYVSSGVREYWLPDPEERMVTLFTLAESGGYQRFVGGVGRMHSGVLPGFEIDLNALFTGLT